MIGQFLVRGVMYELIFKRNMYSFSFNFAAATNKSISTEKAIKWSVIVIFSLSNSYKVTCDQAIFFFALIIIIIIIIIKQSGAYFLFY